MPLYGLCFLRPPLFSSRFLRLACFVLRSIRFPSASCKSSCGFPTSFPPPTLGDGRRGCQKTRTYRGGSRANHSATYSTQLFYYGFCKFATNSRFEAVFLRGVLNASLYCIFSELRNSMYGPFFRKLCKLRDVGYTVTGS